MIRFGKTLALALLVLCLYSHSAWANACTEASQTGNWGTAGTWSNCGGVAPTSADSCALSGTGTITIEATGATDVCGTVDFTGFTGTVTQASGKQLNIAGALTLVSGMTYAPNAAAILNFIATSGSNNITTAAKRVPNMTFNGVGGTWVFQDAVDPVASTTVGVTLTNGSLDTNGKAVGATSGVPFISNNSNTRSLTLGATTWTLPGLSGTLWDITTATGMTLSAASSTITDTAAGGTPGFSGGGLTYGAVTFTGQTGTWTISGANTYANLTLSNGASAAGAFQLAANQHVTGTFTSNGNSAVNRSFITSDTKGTARTITVDTTVTVTALDLQDITGAGAASWNIAAVTSGAGNCGGNSGIVFTAPINAYMKTAVSANWTANNWYTASGGSTHIDATIPRCQDFAIFDANSVTAGSKTITIDASALRLPAMNWTGVLNTPALAFSTAVSAFGSITLISGMTVSGTAILTLEGRGSQTVNSGTLTWTAPITVNAPGGTWTQAANFSSSAAASTAFVDTAGTWSTGGFTFTLTGASAKLNVAGGTFTATGTTSLTGATAANITVSSGTLDATGQTISETGTSSTMTLSGGTMNVGVLTRTGFACTLAGTTLTIGTSTDCTTWAINSGTFKSPPDRAIAFSSGTVSETNVGYCTFGDAGQWPDLNAANDNIRRARHAA